LKGRPPGGGRARGTGNHSWGNRQGKQKKKSRGRGRSSEGKCNPTKQLKECLQLGKEGQNTSNGSGFVSTKKIKGRQERNVWAEGAVAVGKTNPKGKKVRIPERRLVGLIRARGGKVGRTRKKKT